MTQQLNLKVLISDRDFYALESLNSCLAWDRRTRVVGLTRNVDETITYLKKMAEPEYPDVLLLEPESCATPAVLRSGIVRICEVISEVVVVCLAHRVDAAYAAAAQEAGAHGYLLRDDVRMQVVSAIVFAMAHPFVISPGVRKAVLKSEPRLASAMVLPRERKFPGMTDRVRQALWLVVIMGLPAQVAADEMGVSPNTIRSYIKEGYRILEANDKTNYPEDMGPLERAFMRFTALEEDEEKETGDKNKNGT